LSGEDESRAGRLGIEPAAQRRVASADGRFVRLAAAALRPTASRRHSAASRTDVTVRRRPTCAVSIMTGANGRTAMLTL